MALPPFLKNIQNYASGLSIGAFLTKVGPPVLVTSLTLTGTILGLRHLGVMQGMELAAYDHFIQLQPDRGQDERLLVVGIDEIDLQTLQEWPLSDRTLATAIQRLKAYQPKVIGIDVLRDIPIEPGRAELLKELQATKQVITVCKVNSKREFGAAPPPGISPENVGSADLVIDPGGILRRSLLWLTPPASGLIIKKHLCNDPNNTLLTLGFNSALMYLESINIKAELTPTNELKFGSAVFPKFQSNLGGYRNADAGGYQLMLRYRSKNNAATQVRLTDVLNGKVAPELIRNRIVLIGYTTPQAKDDFYTPYSSTEVDSQKMPGVMIHAQSASQILGTVLDGQPLIWVWSLWAEIAWILGCSLVGGLLAWHFRHPFWFSVVVIGASTTIYAVSLLLFLQGGWIPLVPAIMGFTSTAVGVVLLDRFNNSTYGQTVYKTVKTFLHLDVEFDDEKVEQQVLEITESDYFKDLQDTVKTLRGQKNNPDTTPTSRLEKMTNAEDYELDFVQQLKQESQSLKPTTSAKTNAEDYELDFVQQLKQESQSLKPDTTLSSPSRLEDDAGLNRIQVIQQEYKQLGDDVLLQNVIENKETTSIYQSFKLDNDNAKIEETEEDLSFWADLQQQSKDLKKPEETD